MIMGLKMGFLDGIIPGIRFMPDHLLCEKIETEAAELREVMGRIDKLKIKLEKRFEELRILKPDFAKLKVKVSGMEEYAPHVQTAYQEKREAVLETNSAALNDLKDVLIMSDKALCYLLGITTSANAILYRENAKLSRITRKIKRIKGEGRLAFTLMSRINEVKEDMKSITRVLFESARLEEKDLLTGELDKKSKKKLSSMIKEQGIAVDEIGKALEHLKIDDVDEIAKDSEKELKNLKKIQIESMMIIEKLESRIFNIKSWFGLFEEESRKEAIRKFNKSENNFIKTKRKITEQAKKLFEKIHIA